MLRARKTLVATALLAVFAAGPARAIVTATGALPTLPAGLSLDGVGRLSNGCSSVLLAGGGWVLASAHCAAAPGGAVQFGGGVTATVAETVLAPGYTGQVGVDDLSLSRLGSVVGGVAGYGIAAAPAFPAAVVLAGFGAGGSGSTGASAPGGVLRWGYNEYDELLADEPPVSYGGQVVAFDLDSGQAADNRSGGLGLGDGEAGLAGGDSGGPSFARVSGVWSLVGIHVAVDGDLGLGFGGVGYDLLTAPHAGWIAQVTAVPELPPAALLACGLLLLARLQPLRAGSATRVSNLARFTLK